MEEKEEVFRFEEFLNGSKLDELMRMKQDLLDEGVFDEALEFDESDESDGEYDAIDPSINPYNSEFEEESGDGFYNLYRDKSEEFVCDIAVEGVSQKNTEVRLIIESEDWTVMFVGEIDNGKCIIPIKKLSIFNEGQTGRIRLEVNADGNLFTPWKDRFVVKESKKVTVKVNESRSIKKSPKKSAEVRVNVNRKEL